MNKFFTIILLILFTATTVTGQYISEVLEYKPAPGQLINTVPWGAPGSANSIIGSIEGSLTLGAFGGFVVFKFETPIENHPENPYGVDFTIFGNPHPNWSEPGIVWVMKDENGNGQPDDTWHELAGSDYRFSSTKKNHEVTYTNPNQPEAADVPWIDNLGNTGFVYANSFYNQPFYPLTDSFPSVNAENYTLSGTKIQQTPDTSNPAAINLYQRAFGYADNQSRGVSPYTIPDNPYTAEKENSGGDAFDIHWAVDDEGNYVDLDRIHFVKVQNAVLENAGWLGEVSTEITGAVKVEPNSLITGVTELIVIKDLPKEIFNTHFQLEVFAFDEGRWQPETQISWETNMPGTNIDQSNLLTVTASGNLEITARLANNPSISTSVTVTVDLSPASIFEKANENPVYIFPNPALTNIGIYGVQDVEVLISDGCGKIISSIYNYRNAELIDVSKLQPGFYLVHFKDKKYSGTLKFVKQ
ncbi:MAG: T9SS type A sorting domain-containing protein [Bacteroidales bacterium]|nr:T9SS type A sorting domain-containing protein [Bacteroidales bacterium]